MKMAHRRSSPGVLIASFVALAMFGAVIGWAFYASSQLEGGWESLRPILPIVIFGLVLVGGLTGALMWLAFYSSRSGYDEPQDFDEPTRR